MIAKISLLTAGIHIANLVILLNQRSAFAQSDYTILKSFGFPGLSGAFLQGGVVEGSDGALFGTTTRGVSFCG